MSTKLLSLLLFLSFLPGILHSQDTISLEWCLEKTSGNHPRAGNTAIIESITDRKIENIRSGNYPQAELNGKASYQSEAIKLDMNIPVPGLILPESPRDQYKLSLDITQSIYDGGYSKKRQIAEDINEKIDLSRLEIDIRNSRMQVKDLYFAVLLIQKNIEVMDISVSQLNGNRDVILAGIKNGTLLQTDLDLIDVEIIKNMQARSELENKRLAGLGVLSFKLGEEISQNTVLQPTSMIPPQGDSIRRPEQFLFDLQVKQLDQNKSVMKSMNLPKLYAFGQFGYGNPALNLLRDEFKTYYLVGAGLKWNLWDWNTNSRDREILGMQQDIVASRKLQFESEINSALITQKSEIKSHLDNLAEYEKILVLRSRITETSKLQLQQGIIKTLDFLSVQNQETIARIQFENEKILLQQSIALYREINGELY